MPYPFVSSVLHREEEIFDTVIEATVIIEQWSNHDNGIRLHSALGYRPDARKYYYSYQVTHAS